jgi:methylmalonyl-CoA epimerase
MSDSSFPEVIPEVKPLIKGIDHIGIAVVDLESAISQYRTVWGNGVVHKEYIEKDRVNEALVAVGDAYLQFLSPADPSSPVAKFLDRRGEGIHHIGYRVDSCSAAVEALKVAGIKLIDEVPRSGSRGTTIAFVHPASANGMLIELVEE